MLVGKLGLNTIANSVDQQGYQAAHKISKKAGNDLSVSNFGTETKAGKSPFQQMNKQISNDGQRATSNKMKEVTQTEKQFSEKLSYQKNATLAAIRQSTVDMQS